MKKLTNHKFDSHFKIVFILLILQPFFVVSQENLRAKDLINLPMEEFLEVEIVSAAKKAQKLSEAPAKVIVITAKQIKERGYFTLDEALTDLPGFQFRNIQGFNSYVFMRGIPSQNNKILVLIDGIQINELNSGGFYGGGQFNLINVKQIEVVYGPASAQYGTNAVSGIINIITNDPKDIQGTSVSALGGSFSTANVNFKSGQFNAEKEKGYSFSGMYKQSDKADLRGETGDFNWSDQMENYEKDLSFDGKLVFKKLTMGFVYQFKEGSRTTNYKSTGTKYLDTGTKAPLQFINSFARYNYNVKPKWSFQSQLYYRNALITKNQISYITTDVGEKGGQARAYRPNNLFGFENQIHYKPVSRLNVIAGLVLERENLSKETSVTYSGSPDKEAPVPPRPEILTNNLVSFYSNVEIKIVKNLETALGFRFDKSNYYGEVATPQLALIYNNKKISAKLLYMGAFRAPKPWDYWYGTGASNLLPEKIKSFEMILGYSFTSNFKTNISIYKNTLSDILTQEANHWINGDELKTDGVELLLEYSKGKVKSYANYTYNYSVFSDGEKVPEIGNHNANAGILYSFHEHFQIDLRGNYFGEKLNIKPVATTGKDYIDDAFILNSTFSYLNFKNFDFQLIIKNLLNAEYYHTSNRPPDRYRQPQRTILVNVIYTFKYKK